MFRDILTICWSIKEVNRNLQDRESMTDYSIEYLKKACRDLSEILATGKAADLKEEIEVVNRSGKAAKFKMAEVAEMLGVSSGTVKSTLSRGLERLRAVLGSIDGADGGAHDGGPHAGGAHSGGAPGPRSNDREGGGDD